MKTAFPVDNDFFIRQLRHVCGDTPAEHAVAALTNLCSDHLKHLGRAERHLYRILVYDCAPLTKKVHRPISKRALDFSKTDVFKWRTAFRDCLRVQRKVALRLGALSDKHGVWSIRPDALRTLLNAKRQWTDLTDDDFAYEVEQKGVDMRIGLNIASISSKRLADQIVLIAGDSDFVPAAKAARREGVDFVLDSLGAAIPPELHEHIDGLQPVLLPRKSSGTV